MTPDDESFVRYVQENFLVTPDQVGAARILQNESLGKGEPLTLSDALVLSRALSANQRDEACRKLGDLPGPGETLGSYRLLRQIGAGGMGAVFLADDPPNGRQVALKVLPKGHALDREALRRFRQEAESAFRLSHPNIVRGYAAGEDRGFAYYAMEWCEGESLDRRLQREGSLPWREAVEVSAQVARALLYAHEHGLVHRDIKPSNILITRDGQAKLLDLGLSKKLVDLDPSFRTETGAAMGTPHYMAPEQARGARDADGRVDIYGLGATLYHFLTGRVPFPGASIIEIVAQHLEAERPDPRSVFRDLPEGLTHIVRKSMARRPDDRYRDCSEFLSDLQGVLDGKSPQSRPTPVVPRGLLPIVKSLAAATILLTAVSGFLFFKGLRVPEPSPSVNLLGLVDPSRDSIGAPWVLEGGALLSPQVADGIQFLQIPFVPPTEYDLDLTVERRAGLGSLDIGLVVGSHPCAVVFDGWGGGVTGLHLIDGRDGSNNETALRKAFLTVGIPRVLRCKVRRKSVSISVDESVVIDWSGNLERLGIHSAYRAVDPARLFLGTRAPFRISRVQLIPRMERGGPASAAGEAAIGSGGQPPEVEWKDAIDLLARLDLGRHTAYGTWRAEAGGIVCDLDRRACVQFPYEPPEEYDFRIEFTRLEGRDSVAQICSRSGKRFTWEHGLVGDQLSAFLAQVNNPRRLPPQWEGRLESQRRHTSIVQVRKNGCRGFLDGRLLCDWGTDFSEVVDHPQMWGLESSRVLGLGSSGSCVIFHRAQVREVTGRGTVVDPPRPAAPPEEKKPLPPHRLALTSLVGGSQGTPFEEIEGIPIIGFRFTQVGAGDTTILRSIQAVYRGPDGKAVPGQEFGTPAGDPIPVDARPGYAVAAITISGSSRVRGFQVLFRKHEAPYLSVDPADQYLSPWIGFPGAPGKQLSDTKESSVAVGIHGREGTDIGAFGLICFRGERTGSAPSPATVRRAPRVFVQPSVPTRAPSPVGLLGHWPMDENVGSQTADLSPHSRTGMLVNNPTWVEGKNGNALRFTGRGDHVLVPEFELGAKTVTLAAWVRHESLPQAYQRYISLGQEVAVLREQFGGTLTFYVKLSGRLCGVDVPNSMGVGEWTHVAGTWDGQVLRLYKNGREVGSRPYAGVLASGKEVAFSTRNEGMLGAIDDVRIYGHALSRLQIAALAGLHPEELGFRAPDPDQDLVPGLYCDYFEGQWDQLPDFDSLKPSATGIAKQFDLSAKRRETYFGVRFTGYVEIPKDGVYTFFVTSDDGSMLRIGDSGLVMNDGLHAALEASDRIALKKGKHEIGVAYFQSAADHQLEVSWQGPDLSRQPIPASALFRPATRSARPKNPFLGTWMTTSQVLTIAAEDGARVSGTCFYGSPHTMTGQVTGRTLTVKFDDWEGTLELGADNERATGTWGNTQTSYRNPWSARRLDPQSLDLDSALLLGLKHADLQTRRMAAGLLPWKGGDLQAIVRELPKAVRDEDPLVRGQVANFARRAGLAAVPFLLPALGSEDPAERAGAVWLLAPFAAQSADAARALIEKLRDPEPRVRANAAGTLAGIGPTAQEAIPTLVELAKDSDARVRDVASFALARIRGEVVPAPVGPLRAEPGKGSWPQWRGPSRDNVSREGGLLKEWPKDGPTVVWEVRGAGTGIAAPAVAGGRLFVLGYVGDAEMLTALEERSGRLLWSSRVGDALAENGLMRWLGQRTPTVDDDRVYVVQAQGILVCFQASTGKQLWRREYVKDFATKVSGWKLCDRPLVDGDQVVVTGSSVIALRKDDGRLLWKSEPMGTSAHAATVVSDAGGFRQYVAFVQGKMFSVDARNGKLLWTHEPFGQTANSCTPMVLGDSILGAAGYNVGLAYVNVVPTYEGVAAHARYSARLAISPFQDSAVILDRHAFFIGSGGLLCVDIASGKTVWGPDRSIGPGNSSMTCAEGHLYVLSPGGQVTLAEANPEKFVLKASFPFPDFEKGMGATSPVLAGGRLYLRSEDHLLCYDVREGMTKAERPKHVPRVLEIPTTGVAPTGAATVATPQDVVEKMLEVAGLRKEDVVYDLGSGDGRIVVAAARKFGAKATGFEIDETLVGVSRKIVEDSGLKDRVTIEQKDLFAVNLAPASVVAVYLPEEFLERLKPRLADLKPGSRIVSHQFKIPGAVPDRQVRFESSEDGDIHWIYLWTTPLKKDEK